MYKVQNPLYVISVFLLTKCSNTFGDHCSNASKERHAQELNDKHTQRQLTKSLSGFIFFLCVTRLDTKANEKQ